MTDEQLRLRLKELKVKRYRAFVKFMKHKKQLDNEINLIKAILGDDK